MVARLKLWTSLVRPVLTYGLHTLELQAAALRRINHAAFTMASKIRQGDRPRGMGWLEWQVIGFRRAREAMLANNLAPPSTAILSARFGLLQALLHRGAAVGGGGRATDATDAGGFTAASAQRLIRQLFYRGADWRRQWPPNTWRKRPKQARCGYFAAWIDAFEGLVGEGESEVMKKVVGSIKQNGSETLKLFVALNDIQPGGYTTDERLIASGIEYRNHRKNKGD